MLHDFVLVENYIIVNGGGKYLRSLEVKNLDMDTVTIAQPRSARDFLLLILMLLRSAMCARYGYVIASIPLFTVSSNGETGFRRKQSCESQC